MKNIVQISDFLDITFNLIKVMNDKTEISFQSGDHIYTMFHDQDCNEEVYLESVVGDLKDLIGEPIIRAEEVVSREKLYGFQEDAKPIFSSEDSRTYTFYKLATCKGYVDFRWVGRSNGYYSEKVSILKEKLVTYP